MDHKSEGFEAWVQSLPIEELEKEYREASSNYGNSTDSEAREYFGDLRHELVEELEHRERLAKRKTKGGPSPYRPMPEQERSQPHTCPLWGCRNLCYNQCGHLTGPWQLHTPTAK